MKSCKNTQNLKEFHKNPQKSSGISKNPIESDVHSFIDAEI